MSDARQSASGSEPATFHGNSRRKLLIAASVGAVAGAVAVFVTSWQLTMLVAFDAAAVTHLALVWAGVRGLDAAATKATAQRQDETRAVSSAVLLVASVASLGAVIVGLVKAEQVGGAERAALSVAAVVGVIAGWSTVHSVFMLHYADRYYAEQPEGGIDFPGGEAPDYSDFAYLSFTVGMTYQVSDTNIESRPIRRMVKRQALMSFVFGTVIIATTINLLAGFIG